jgi:hypothetical protein
MSNQMLLGTDAPQRARFGRWARLRIPHLQAPSSQANGLPGPLRPVRCFPPVEDSCLSKIALLRAKESQDAAPAASDAFDGGPESARLCGFRRRHAA